MYTESTIRPEFKEQFPRLLRINFDITEEERTDPQTEEKHTVYCFQSIEVSPGADYSTLVSAIITGKYTIDAQIAMLANKGDGNAEHEATIAVFEAWRTHAKEVAKQVLGMEK